MQTAHSYALESLVKLENLEMYTFYFITYFSSLYKQRIYCKKKTTTTIFEERLTQTKAYNKKNDAKHA